MTAAWPFDDLVLLGPELTLRPVRDADLATFVAILPTDFELDPAYPPLAGVTAAADRERLLMQSIWRHRGCWSVDDWALDFGVWRDGQPLGIQTLEGTAFSRGRTVDSASWIAEPFRGRGFGTGARELVLAFAFERLGADKAITSAVTTNQASLGVSRHLGYRDNGTSPHDTGTGTVQLQHLVLDRADWVAQRRTSMTVNGFEPCQPFFGPA